VIAAWGLNVSEPPFDREIAAEEGHVAYLADV
jgi:hypothetical protein